MGRYDATPIVGTFIGGAGAETRTVAALNQLSVKRQTIQTTVVTGATSNIQNLASTVGMRQGDLLTFASTPPTSAKVTLVQDLNHVLLATSLYTFDGETVSDDILAPINKGLITSYDFNTGLARWKMSPVQESSLTFQEDNDNANVVVFNTGAGSDWTSATTVKQHRSADYLTSPVISPPLTSASSSTVEYRTVSPTGTNLLNPGPYEIYVWIPGNSNGVSFAHALQYEVHEGGTVSTFTVDQSTPSGWTKIGTRSFQHGGVISPLKLVVTNFSADPGDVGLQAFTDAVRFVGPSDLAVKSTPLQVTVPIRMTPGGTPVDHPVVIVAAENGMIYCLDAEGRGDGSTDSLWTYPSTPDPDVAPGSWLDPNLNLPDNIDGKGNQLIAEMPSHFNLSSAVVATVTRGGVPEQDLFIGADNGRVYCIDMAGRGDFNLSTRKPGTTTRLWTYPDDYPVVPAKPSLSAIRGSVAIVQTAAFSGNPTVLIPTDEGRLYAVDAGGNTASRTTTFQWAYPKLTDPTLGPIRMTPAADFSQVFVGSESPDFGSSPGVFAALNQDTGVPNWTFTAPTTRPLTDFDGGPTTVDSVTLGGSMPDTVFVANDNLGLYALDVTNGNILYESYEMEAPATSPLTYTFMSVYDTSGAQTPTPVVVAPQNDGRISIFDAIASAITLTGGHRVGGYTTQSNNLTDSVSVGDGFMYFGDNAGYLYALSMTAGVFPPGTVPPLGTIAGGNNPSEPDYANAKVKLVTKNAYLQLRQGTMYYADALDPANAITRNPMAFEWGETIYLLVYNFPYMRAGTTTPPVINLNFSVGGETVRNVFTEAHLFPGVSDPPGSPNPPYYPDPSYPLFSPSNPFGGYAILSFTIQGAGANALPPGEGQITVGFNTVDTSGAPINYPSSYVQTVYVANPLSLVIPSPDGVDQTIGYTNVTSNLENLSNGSETVSNLLGTVGGVTHGQSASLGVGVVDRSLVELIRGPGRGLQNVRVERADMVWRNSNVPGYGSPLNPINRILLSEL